MRGFAFFLFLFLISFFYIGACRPIDSSEEDNMKKQENLSIELHGIITRENGLTSNEMFFCRFLLPEKTLSYPPFVLNESLKNEDIMSLFLAIKPGKRLDISPIANYKDKFNSLFLEASNVDLSNKDILPAILTLKGTSNESLNTLPVNTIVKCLTIDKIDIELSAFLPKFNNLQSLAVGHYNNDVVILKKDVPKLQCLRIRKGKFKKLLIEDNINLRTLILENFPLKNLQALKGLQIEELWIMNSNIDDFSAIATLSNLKKLYIVGCPLNELSFLQGKKVDVLDIHGTPMAERKLPEWIEAGKIVTEKSNGNIISPNRVFFP